MHLEVGMSNSDELHCLINKLETDFEGDEYWDYEGLERHSNILKDIDDLKNFDPKIDVDIH